MDPADVFGGDSPDDDSAFEAFVTKEIKQPKIEPPKADPLPNIPFIKDDFNSPPEDDSPPKKPQKRKFRDSEHTEQPHCLGLKVEKSQNYLQTTYFTISVCESGEEKIKILLRSMWSQSGRTTNKILIAKN